VKPAAPRTAPRKPPRKLPAWLARARNLLLTPNQEWTTIAGEFATAGPIYGRFLVPLVAIGPGAAMIGTLAFGVRSTLGAGTYPMPALDAITDGVLQYLLGLVGVYALALVIDMLAPMFSAQRNPVQALKVAAYASTPYWLGGIFAIIPKLSPLGLLMGLYSFRLLALGLPTVMKAPRDRTGAYTLTVAIASVLIALLARALPGIFL